jgi:hypothetical protein
MNFKLIRLQYKFILQIAFFLLYLAMLAGILAYNQNHRGLSRLIGSRFSDMRNIVSESYISENNFLIYTGDNDNFYQSGLNEYTQKFQTQTDRLKDTLRMVLNERIIGRNDAVKNLSDSVTSAIDDYTATFNQLLLSVKELGTDNSGKIKAIQTDLEKLIRAMLQLHETEFNDIAFKLTRYETDFLFASNKSALFEIELLLDNLSDNEVIISSGSLVNEDINQLIESLHSQLKSVNDLQEQIGFGSGGSGLLGEMAQKYDSLNQLITELECTVQNVDKNSVV